MWRLKSEIVLFKVVVSECVFWTEAARLQREAFQAVIIPPRDPTAGRATIVCARVGGKKVFVLRMSKECSLDS